jgi:hypothetical protein
VTPPGFPYLPTTVEVGANRAVDSNPNPALVTLPNDFASDLTIDFGFWQPAALGDFVWHDINANGQQDGGEPGIPGVSVTLYTCANVMVADQLTDANGKYLFTNLMPGCYYVTFASVATFVPSPSNVGNDVSDSDSVAGKTGNYTLVAGETNLTVDAGFTKLAALGDYVWKDLDVDGVQDAGEPGIGGVVVTLYKCGIAGAFATMNTNAAGFYLFSNLVPGCYYVTFGTPAGMTASPSNVGNDALDSDSVGGTTGNYILSSGETNLTVDAGFYQQKAALGDFVWKDNDQDGQQDAGEPGIPGVLVTLLNCDGSPTGQTQVTDAAGKYLFQNLVPGCYKVQFGTPAGMTASPSNVGSDVTDSDSVGGFTGNYTLAPGETNLTVDAGFYVFNPPICIPASFDFTQYGNSSLTGAAGNIRSFSSNGVNLHVSAFSEIKPGGSFAPAYLGLYSHGFGVTDGSENGSNNTHTVDNAGRNNYVLFEFSQTVAVDKAYLDYIVGDSDVSVWIGNINNAYNSHINLNAATLTALGFTEVSEGGNTSRWADINAGGLFGNVLVIAAKATETNDGFKLSKVTTACVPTVCDTTGTFSFTGSTGTSGSAGNIRTFSANGVNVKASGFSRSDAGSWAAAYLGSYSHGLGVTDTSEGTGGNDTHTVDNMGGRDNYVLLEFSKPVVFDKAFLDYVGADSDVTVWIGTKTDPYNNHLTLNDALLAGFKKETDLTDSPDSRWADLNDEGTMGNVVIISAQHDDASPEDSFKLSKVAIGCIPEVCTATGTLAFTGSTASSGTAGNIRGYSVGGINVKASAFSRTDGGTWAAAYLGAYSSGLGVTDSGEGDGSNDRHKIDNIGGRNNYVLLEFSQPVVIDKAFLDAVGADSDVSVWIGTKSDPYNNHQTLSDALLSGLTREDNATPDATSGSRWAELNGTKKAGNVIIISSLAGDDTPEDAFKLSKIALICP